jgi:Family of unknown function (DUF6188)
MALLATSEVPLAGFVVTDIWFSGRIRLIAAKPSSRGGNPLQVKIWFGGPLTFRGESGRVHDLDAGGAWEFLIALFELRHQVIESAVADEASRIQICFELGQILAAETQPQDENWGLLGPDGLHLVGMPTGWPHRPDRLAHRDGN